MAPRQKFDNSRMPRHPNEHAIRFARLDWIMAGVGLCTVRDGIFMFPRADSIVSRVLTIYGEWSPGEMRLFEQLISPGDDVVEVGAHIGSHSIGLARLVGANGRVFSFEPQNYLYTCLMANAELNNLPQLITLNAAAGDCIAKIAIPQFDYSKESNFGCMSLAHRAEDVAVLPHYEVDLITVDSLNLNQLRLLKVDAEGMELSVLEGARDTIARTRPILYVECDRPGQHEPLKAFLSKIGYDARWHRPPLFTKDNWAGHPEDTTRGLISANLLCYPAGAKLKLSYIEYLS